MNRGGLRSALAYPVCAVAACLAALALGACSSNGGSGGTPDSGTPLDSASPSDSGGMALDGGTPEPDSSMGDGGAEVDSGDGGALIDREAPLDAPEESNCDAGTLPDLTQGEWLICNAVATNGVVWTGTLSITSETPTCTGASLGGGFSWIGSNGVTGTTVAQGSYVAATQQITLSESQATGGVVSATDYMTYDPATDQLVNGSWTCSCPTATWSTATRVATDGGATCSGDM
jgi:hypothetical protein